jgi:hypothetical protein
MIFLHYKVFFQLLQRDLTLFANHARDNYINTLCWVILSLIVYQFIMPHLGCVYAGDFLLVNCVISKAFFGIMDGVSATVADLDGDKKITYDMTLPISHTLLFIKIAISHAIHAFLLSLFILPAGTLFLWNHLSFPYFCWYKFIIIMIISSIFSGFFSLFIIGITKSIMQIEDVWCGIIFPLFGLGGFQFTWKAMYQVSPIMSYINCLNPVMYMFEGMRAATLNPTLSINFYTCCIALILFTIPAGYIGSYLLHRRLDTI